MVDPAEYIGVKMRLHVDVLRVSVVKVDEVATSSRLEELDGARIPQDVVAYELDLAAPSDDLTHAHCVEFVLACAVRCKGRTHVEPALERCESRTRASRSLTATNPTHGRTDADGGRSATFVGRFKTLPLWSLPSFHTLRQPKCFTGSLIFL